MWIGLNVKLYISENTLQSDEKVLGVVLLYHCETYLEKLFETLNIDQELMNHDSISTILIS